MPPNEGSATIIVPGFQTGGNPGNPTYSEGTGNKEESVQQGQVINYYFPVEIEVIGRLDEVAMERVAQYVYDELLTALQNQTPLRT